MSITQFYHQEDSNFVSWLNDGKLVQKSFGNNIYALKLNSGQRVIIVELKPSKTNAFIYDRFGNPLKEITSPDPESICFGDVFYSNNDLTLISRRADGKTLACIVDESGEIIKTYLGY